MTDAPVRAPEFPEGLAWLNTDRPLRLSEELTEEFRSTYGSGDVTQYGATMRGYSSVPAELLADTSTLAGWFDRSWEWIGTLPPKPTKKK